MILTVPLAIAFIASPAALQACSVLKGAVVIALLFPLPIGPTWAKMIKMKAAVFIDCSLDRPSDFL
jgi:hypothetical protein